MKPEHVMFWQEKGKKKKKPFTFGFKIDYIVNIRIALFSLEGKG